MPDMAQISLASVPTTAKGVIKTDSKFKNATEENPISVIVATDKDGNGYCAPVAGFIIEEQYSNNIQVYVTGAKTNESGEVTEIRIARNHNGQLTAIAWISDFTYITIGTLNGVKTDTGNVKNDNKIVIVETEPVQTEPETTTVDVRGKDERPLESFIFFDPFANAERDYNTDKSSLSRALGMQRDVGRFMNLCGNGEVTEKQQKILDERVHLIPFSDIKGNILDEYPELRPMAEPGINTDKNAFINLWNDRVFNSKVHVVILQNHGSHEVICLDYNNGTNGIKKDVVEKLNMPPIDYMLLIACNAGNLSFSDNIATIITKHTVGGNPKKLSIWESIAEAKDSICYPTGVVAADGKTSSYGIDAKGAVTNDIKRYIVSMENVIAGKFDNSNIQIEGKGFCVFLKDVQAPVPIDDTAAKKDKYDSSKWIQPKITVYGLLQAAKQICNKYPNEGVK